MTFAKNSTVDIPSLDTTIFTPSRDMLSLFSTLDSWKNLTCRFEQVSAFSQRAIVTTPQHLVDELYDMATCMQQKVIHVYGFERGKVPLEYIKNNYLEHLTAHIKEFLLKFCTGSFVLEKLLQNKIASAGEPRLEEVYVVPGKDAHFTFTFSTPPPIEFFEWRYLPFRAPKRKNYKDLDRQVENFLFEEKTLEDTYHGQKGIVNGDLVLFSLSLMNSHQTLIENTPAPLYWFRLGTEDGDNPLREEFLGRHVGDSFATNNEGLQEFFSCNLRTNYTFYLTIFDIVPTHYFCIEQFKRYFKIKTNKELHQKLIEVFSYRHDISQRRAMVEEVLKLMLNKHAITTPKHLILRQQKLLLEAVEQHADYQVYRIQADFNSRIIELAEKQAREIIFIDQFSYHEDLTVSDSDARSYLTLTTRARMKDFLYFDLYWPKIQGQEMPISLSVLKKICLREKAVNHIIHHLTKK